MSKKLNPSFAEFRSWYIAARDRFKVADRKYWDRIANLPTAPNNFRWELSNAPETTELTIWYNERTASHSSTIYLGRNYYYRFVGAEAILKLADLEHAGRITNLNHPSLGDALVTVSEFREEVDQLVLWYTLNQEGDLEYIYLSNCNGLLRVKYRAEVKHE